MLIYRVEDSEGYGPFRSDRNPDFYPVWLEGANGNTHPEVRVVLHAPNNRFGCKSLEDLAYWFGHAVESLYNHSVMVYQVDPSTVVQEGRQLVYNKGSATLVDQFPVGILAHI